MFPQPLTVTVLPSRRLRLGMGALHGLALGAVWLAQWGVAWQAGASLLLALSAAPWARRPPAPLTLRCSREGQVSISTPDGWAAREILGTPVSLPWMALLRLRAPGQKGVHPLLVLPDSLAAEDFRRLRVWLRWIYSHS